MKIVVYIIRFLLALLFLYAGAEKLFLPFDPKVFKAQTAMADPLFFEFYNILQGSGYMYFVGVFQFLCGFLLIFKRTYLLGSIMLVPLLLCLLMTHIYISLYPFYIAFDAILITMNLVILFSRYKDWQPVLLQKQKGII